MGSVSLWSTNTPVKYMGDPLSLILTFRWVKQVKWVPQVQMEKQQAVARGHEWCLGAKGNKCLCNGSEPVSCLQGLLGGGFSHYPFIKGFHWPDPGQAHMSATHRQVLNFRLPQFPGQTAAQRIPDGSATEQITSDRPPEATGGCLLCRQPTLKAKKSHSHYLEPQWGFRMMLTGKCNSSEPFK